MIGCGFGLDKFIRADASERDVIQKFLEEFPWLLDPKMSKFEREITYINLLKRKFADESELPESNRRLDFLCTNSSGTIHIIELKRPSIKLRTKEIQQISEYVEFIETQFPQTQGHVKGFLISDNMTYEPGAEKVRKGLESVDIYVKSYSDLLAEARRYNDDLYRMGYKDPRYFTKEYMKPLLKNGELVMTIPDKPNSKNQKYVTKK